MKLTTPKQLFVDSKTYYVDSESNPTDKHIVVDVVGTYFCDCRDFMVRHLPLYGTLAFSLCKHGEFARDEQSKPKKFVVWALGNVKSPSGDVTGIFDTRQEAQNALDRYNLKVGNNFPREVRQVND